MVGLGRFLRLFRAILTHFCRLLKPTLPLPGPTPNLQFADDSADISHTIRGTVTY